MLKSVLPVEGNSSLVRDMKTNAIVNISKTDYSDYKKMVNKREADIIELNSLREELSELKKIVSELVNKK